MKKIIFTILISTLFRTVLLGQANTEVSTYNNFTFYYLDNSAGSDNTPMSNDLVNTLKINLHKLKGRTENYLLFFASNSNNYKTEYNLNKLVDPNSILLNTYFSRPSKPCDYDFDKKVIRELLTDNPLFIKQSVELNFYLSSNAVKKAINNIDELPIPFLMYNEILSYLQGNNFRVKINIYTDNAEYSTELKKQFTFCNKELNIEFPIEIYII